MTLPRSLFDAVIVRDGPFCLLALADCEGEATTLDHRANRGSGGSKLLDDPVNLIPACWRCNGDKADAHGVVLVSLERRGLYVLPHATHAKTLERVRQTPVEYLDGERFLLLSTRDARGQWVLGRLNEGEITREVIADAS